MKTIIFRIFCITSLLLAIAYLSSKCLKYIAKARSPTEIVLEGNQMGTFWRVNMINVDMDQKMRLREKIQYQLDCDNQLLSTFKKDSILMQFNQSNSTALWSINEEIADIVTTSLRVGYKTYGAMDITIGALINLWGFGYSPPSDKPPGIEKIKDAQKRGGLQHLMVINQAGKQFLKKNIPNLFLDLSTVGEGYAADHIATLIEKEGIFRYLVSVGSAIFCRGMNMHGIPWRIAIKKPNDQKNDIQEIVSLNGYGISTSGSYQNYYEQEGKQFAHIIDPKTGKPITHNLVSITVISRTALEADAWDTGLMVLGLEKTKEVALRYGLAVYAITKNTNGYDSWMSPQFSSFLIDKRRD